MSAIIIDGKKISSEMKDKLKIEIEDFKRKNKITPGLAVIRIGDDPASLVYVRNKRKMCEELGMISYEENPSADIKEEDVLLMIKKYNNNPFIHGILVQLPLPSHIQTDKVIQTIDPRKDADGFHPVNLGLLLAGVPNLVPCTPAGCAYILDASGVKVDGKTVVIIGRSLIVGKPLANLLLLKAPNRNATVIVCHSHTPDIKKFTRQADILIAAIGRAGIIKGDMIRPGAVVIDVGVNKVGEKISAKTGKPVPVLKGDVEFDEAKEVASMITPVPGGVGPMTISFLMQNTLIAARNLTK